MVRRALVTALRPTTDWLLRYATVNTLPVKTSFDGRTLQILVYTGAILHNPVVVLERAIDGFALSIDRAALLDNHPFASPSLDRAER